MAVWDPAQYERFADHRTRPFFDLLDRVGAENPSLVVDLGCGNGPLTLAMAQRWPAARVVGVDSSVDMLERARALDRDARVEWVHADVAAWDLAAVGSPDVVISNATLQWVPTHRELVPRWLEALVPGGWFAMQVPGNFAAPSHVAIREVAAAQPRGAELTAALREAPVGEPASYADLLAPSCPRLDVWETTYLQVLDPAGEQDAPVLEWVKGTALRPLLDLLKGAEREAFLDDLRARLAREYPRSAYGTPFPFRRIFAVGQVAGGGDSTEKVTSVRGLHHVQVACPAGSEERLRAFYSSVLGLTEIEKPPALRARGGCWFRAGVAQIHCGVEEDFRPARKAHPCLLVEDVDALAGAVADAGGAVRWDDQIEGVRRFHADDPVGNRIEIQQA
ncbi:methyltransferase domain-containing protein [Luteipulveratus flavus]|uniref:methyltransferase domain-containing protein n=1 Tax=Luteipulveratus flavus TaxID=3031728 RepID=UPI00319DCF0B